MTRLRSFGLLIVATHWAVAVWHLFLATKVLSPPDDTVNWLAIIVLSLVHIAVLVAWWKLPDRFAGLTFCIFLAGALIIGIYEHFLSAGLNNIFKIAPGDWSTAFRTSVYVLLLIEAVGCWPAIRLLKTRPRDKAYAY